MLSQDPRKTPDLVECVVEGGGGHADDVGLAKIAFHTSGFELL